MRITRNDPGADLNEVHLRGRIVGRPYAGHTRRGRPKLVFALSMRRGPGRPPKWGLRGEETDHVMVLVLGTGAEVLGKTIAPGRCAEVRGFIQDRKVKAGRIAVECVAEEVIVYGNSGIVARWEGEQPGTRYTADKDQVRP